MKQIKNKSGFSLVEMLLVISIISVISFMKMQYIQEEQISFQAKTIGEQLDQIQNITGQFPIELDNNGYNVRGAFYFDGSQVGGKNAKPGGSTDELVKFDSSRVVRAGKETRGRNLAFMYIIRAE